MYIYVNENIPICEPIILPDYANQSFKIIYLVGFRTSNCYIQVIDQLARAVFAP